MDSMLPWLAAALGCSLVAGLVNLRERMRDRHAEDGIRARMRSLGVDAALDATGEASSRGPSCLWSSGPPIFGRRPAVPGAQTP